MTLRSPKVAARRRCPNDTVAPRIKAFLMRGGGDPEVAQEVAQEALILVWRKAASFDRRRAR